MTISTMGGSCDGNTTVLSIMGIGTSVLNMLLECYAPSVLITPYSDGLGPSGLRGLEGGEFYNYIDRCKIIFQTHRNL